MTAAAQSRKKSAGQDKMHGRMTRHDIERSVSKCYDVIHPSSGDMM